jgi:hypothetical protein
LAKQYNGKLGIGNQNVEGNTSKTGKGILWNGWASCALEAPDALVTFTASAGTQL